MKYLVIDLKENLKARRKKEISFLENLNAEKDKDIILISAGKINELDFLLEQLNELLDYSERTKQTEK
jgi:GTPase Era involved in 16S rRNA processing